MRSVIAAKFTTTSFDVNDIQDEEFEKTVKGDKWTLKN